jgi:hypothetical protein
MSKATLKEKLDKTTQATSKKKPRGKGFAKGHTLNKDKMNKKMEEKLTQHLLTLELMEQFKQHPLIWGKYFFDNHFRLESPDFHHIMMEEAKTNKFLAIAAPRGSSKTTIVGFVYPIHQICFKQKRFIVYISNTFKQATMMLSTIKSEIKENTQIKQAYPIEITKDAEDVAIFRHADGFETMVICLGADQMGNIRGRKFGAYRPDLILGDDIENDELVRSPERRLKLQEDFDNAVLPAGDIETQYFVVGTILHDDSLLAKLMSKNEYHEFEKVFFQGLYRDKETGEQYSLWDKKMTVEWLLDYKKHKPHTFAREIQNNPSASGTEEIDKRDFRYWRIENMNYMLFDNEGNIKAKGELSTCKAAIACDLAWEDKQESDYTAIVPVYLTPQSDILVEEFVCKKGVKPDEFEEILFNMEERLRAITNSTVPIGFEKAKLEKVMKWFLKQAMRRRNKFLMLKDLNCSKEKIERIVTVLQPRYSQHTIYHKRGMGDLETQLIRIRSTAHDDLADALGMAVRLLQFPKQIKKKMMDEDDNFMKLRRWNIDKKSGIGKSRIGGFIKNKRFEIPSVTCPV